jgi:hypothetical protein
VAGVTRAALLGTLRGMGKAKREDKQKKREDKEAALALEQENARRMRIRRIVVIAIPIVTAGAATATWFAAESEAATGAVVLLGAILWLLFGLGFLGGSIKPRDRTRAGSINYGSRR